MDSFDSRTNTDVQDSKFQRVWIWAHWNGLDSNTITNTLKFQQYELERNEMDGFDASANANT